MAKNGKEIVVAPTVDISGYRITTEDFKKTVAIIGQNVGNEGISPFDLVRAQNPSGKILKWEIPSLLSEETESMSSVEGVILYHKNIRAYYPNPYGEGDEQPQCSSRDAIVGEGDPGGSCLHCPLAKWGSGRDANGQPTKGQACMTRKHLFLLREGTRLPMMFSLPPTSLKSARMYFLELGDREIPYWHIISKLSLDKKEKPQPHAVFKFNMVGLLPQEAQGVMDNLKEFYEPFLSESEVTPEDKEVEPF